MLVVTLENIKRAIRQKSFRDLFPELADDFRRAIEKPGCDKCTVPLWKKLDSRRDLLKKYFGEQVEFNIQLPMLREDLDQEPPRFQVINCNVAELSDRLNSIQFENKPIHISMARFEDQITVIVQE